MLAPGPARQSSSLLASQEVCEWGPRELRKYGTKLHGPGHFNRAMPQPLTTMATPLMSRSPTCLTCLRRVSQTICSGSPASLTQVRGKKTSGRPTDRGVLVRLLEDVPKFGRKGVQAAYHGGLMNYFTDRGLL